MTATNAGLAVANVLVEARNTSRPDMPIFRDARIVEETVLEAIARIIIQIDVDTNVVDCMSGTNFYTEMRFAHSGRSMTSIRMAAKS